MTSTNAHDARSLGQPETDVAYALANGEIAVIRRSVRGFSKGTLARLSLAGGPAKDLVADVYWADGTDDGNDAQVAVARRAEGRFGVELPVAHKVADVLSPGSTRISPDGSKVAFVDYTGIGDDDGQIFVVDRDGKRVFASEAYNSVEGVAWRSNDELWFTAAKEGRALALFATRLDAAPPRLVYRAPGRLVLHDVHPESGRAVAERNSYRPSVIVGRSDDGGERDLSWQDYAQLAQISFDGTQLLFTEEGDGAGASPVAYLRAISGAPPLRLGRGVALALARDASQALLFTADAQPSLVLVPIGAGAPRPIAAGGITSVSSAAFVGASSRVVLSAREGQKQERLYLLDTAGGDAKPIADEGVTAKGDAISADGTWIAATTKGKPILVAIDGGETKTLDGLGTEHTPLAWTTDGGAIFVMGASHFPIEIFRYEIATKKLTPWRTLRTADPAGILNLGRVRIARDGGVYAYESYRLLSDLYVIENLV